MFNSVSNACHPWVACLRDTSNKPSWGSHSSDEQDASLSCGKLSVGWKPQTKAQGDEQTMSATLAACLMLSAARASMATNSASYVLWAVEKVGALNTQYTVGKASLKMYYQSVFCSFRGKLLFYVVEAPRGTLSALIHALPGDRPLKCTATPATRFFHR